MSPRLPKGPTRERLSRPMQEGLEWYSLPTGPARITGRALRTQPLGATMQALHDRGLISAANDGALLTAPGIVERDRYRERAKEKGAAALAADAATGPRTP